MTEPKKPEAESSEDTPETSTEMEETGAKVGETDISAEEALDAAGSEPDEAPVDSEVSIEDGEAKTDPDLDEGDLEAPDADQDREVEEEDVAGDESPSAETDADTAAPEDDVTQPAADDTDAERMEGEQTAEPDLLPDPHEVPEAPPAVAKDAPPPTERVVVERRGGVLAGVVGGAIAVIGAVFAAPYVLPESMRPVTSLAPVEEQIAAQSTRADDLAARIDELAAQLEDAATGQDLGALSDRLDTEGGETTARIESLAEALAEATSRTDALTARLEEAERRPLEDSADPAVVAALEAYGREVEAIRSAIEEQTNENARLIQEAAEATAAARAAAEAEAAAAAERAAFAARQQALVDIQAALESGEPFADALGRIDGVDAPAALAAVAVDGVDTLATLQAEFSEPARAALDTARRAAAPEDPGARTVTFLQTQLGMRSLAPRDGESADAILSRAEAAARAGDLATAVSEIAALPQPAQDAMADWVARATIRAEALSAADDLAQQLSTN